MFAVPQPVKTVSHPLIKDMYMKKDFYRRPRDEDVLVIETVDIPRKDDKDPPFDCVLSSLLMDLENLKKDIEREVGPFDRIDIRTH